MVIDKIIVHISNILTDIIIINIIIFYEDETTDKKIKLRSDEKYVEEFIK